MRIFILLPLLIFFVLVEGNAQKAQIDQLMLEGNQAFQQADFQTAKSKFKAIVEKEPLNKTALFNLGALELNLGNQNGGCTWLQKAYSAGDSGSFELIKTYCNGVIESEAMFSTDVDEMPKFKYKGQWEEFRIGNKINPKYTKLFQYAFRSYDELKPVRGVIMVFQDVDNSGNIHIQTDDQQLTLKQIEILQEIFETTTSYKPATYKGINRTLKDRGILVPLSF
ncbi:tetratricopeptide repeat protein [Nonlabens marinus]|uniref:Uncharacterized protein n=1 Tax=Nonlabens marinus S1-08 TaxID=1454201 RepID=W8W0G3_9FLAO|nr:tetratricopeptide repeat protein [Nonlabens marinus]BAO56276.1 hypothetical protein NMS_2267 [Nonlabens marinus S1-08]